MPVTMIPQTPPAITAPIIALKSDAVRRLLSTGANNWRGCLGHLSDDELDALNCYAMTPRQLGAEKEWRKYSIVSGDREAGAVSLKSPNEGRRVGESAIPYMVHLTNRTCTCMDFKRHIEPLRNEYLLRGKREEALGCECRHCRIADLLLEQREAAQKAAFVEQMEAMTVRAQMMTADEFAAQWERDAQDRTAEEEFYLTESDPDYIASLLAETPPAPASPAVPASLLADADRVLGPVMACDRPAPTAKARQMDWGN